MPESRLDLPLVEFERASASPPASVHGSIGMVNQGGGIYAVVRVHGDADAARAFS